MWSPGLQACSISGTKEYLLSITINFIEDFVLLSVMFFGVLHKRNATHLWNMLYLQALFWILAATFTELPSVACLFWNHLHLAHCAPSHRHWVLKISTVSLSRACLKCRSNLIFYRSLEYG